MSNKLKISSIFFEMLADEFEDACNRFLVKCTDPLDEICYGDNEYWDTLAEKEVIRQMTSNLFNNT